LQDLTTGIGRAVRCNRCGGATINTYQIPHQHNSQCPISRISLVYHNCLLGRGTVNTIFLCHVFLVASLLLLFLFIPSRFITVALLDSNELALTKLIRAHAESDAFSKDKKETSLALKRQREDGSTFLIHTQMA